MALNYLFTKYKDTYSLKNTGTLNLNYSVKLKFCEEETLIETGTLVPGSNPFTFNLNKDGLYLFTISNGTDTAIVKVMCYDRLLASLVRGIETEICGCGCADCSDTSDCESQLLILNKALSFSFLTKPQYTTYVEAIAAYMNCKLDDAILCIMNSEKIHGSAKLGGLYNQFILIHYLAFYLYDLKNATDTEEIQFIETKYRTNKILSCLKNNCIDLKTIKNLVNTLGQFSIISGIYINQPPSSVGDNTINVANRATTTLTLAMFTTGTTPPYADPEGDAVENLRINSISNTNTGVFYYNGNPITVGQIIPATGIAAGFFIHESPDQNAVATDSFTFSLSDIGSHNYTPA